MARIKADLAAARESLAYARFRNGATASQVNKELEDNDGIRMNLARLYAIKRSAETSGGIPARVKAKSTKVSKATKKSRKAA